MATIGERFRNAWNAFAERGSSYSPKYNEMSYSSRPDRFRYSYGTEKTIATSAYNRIAIDVASINIRHVKVDDNGKYKETVNDNLNEVFTTSANLDQTGRAFFQDAVQSLFDEGCIAIVPTDLGKNPFLTESLDILSLRVGTITQWYPKDVKIKLYNEDKGIKEEVLLPKRMVAIVENPLYAIMNEPNSTFKRLVNKLRMMDAVDQQQGSNKLDMIIQLPYVIRNEQRRAQAEQRRKDIEVQLASSKYGVAYTDGTEKIVQLNRSLENNLQQHIEYLTKLFYSQLGITEEILNGTASEEVMLNYYNRTVEPVLSAITDEMKRKFLTKTARSQGHSIMFFRDPFKLTPVNQIAEIADKFTRNEIMSTNEVRGLIGFKPVDDEKANELRNKNLNAADGQTFASTSEGEEMTDADYQNFSSQLDGVDSQIDELERLANE